MSKNSPFHRDPIYQKPSNDYEIWESDWSEFVTEYYGIPYRLQQWEMHGQNTYIELDCENPGEWEYGEIALAKWKAAWQAADRPPAEDVSFSDNKEAWKARLDFIRSEGCYLDALLWDLVRKGVMPAGKYLIKIWW